MMMNSKKIMATIMAGVMSFGILSATLAVPAEAASHRNYDPPRIEQDRDMHNPPPERKNPPKKTKNKRNYSEGHSSGEVATAAVVGAVIGAVLAKNT